MTLQAGFNVIDAGEILPNINDGLESAPDLPAYQSLGKLPDQGAHEYGQPLLPVYGPR